MVITSILRGLDFFIGGKAGCDDGVFLRPKAMLFSFLNEERQQF